MGGRQLDVDDEDLGIREFQIRKRRAVERAIEKIRHSKKKDWAQLDSDDIDVLEWALGETWAMMGFRQWEHIGFSLMDIPTAKQIVELGKLVLDNKKTGTHAVEEIQEILKNLELKTGTSEED